MEKNKENRKKPLKLSSTGRLQIRKNLGPTGDKPRGQGNKKTIQIVFRNKNNQQKSSSTTQSNFRATENFDKWLKKNKLVGIYGVDTRKITQILRGKSKQIKH